MAKHGMLEVNKTSILLYKAIILKFFILILKGIVTCEKNFNMLSIILENNNEFINPFYERSILIEKKPPPPPHKNRICS